MSTQAGVRAIPAPVVNRERGHRFRLRLGWSAAVSLTLALSIYGFNYYALDAAHRPFSPKHELLKPSGTIGSNLGMLGALMFLGIFLYPIRKRWAWLSRQGSSKRWLDFHVLLGVSAPIVILFHSSFKFRGIAGMAFWIMTAVALSGVVGRYLYAQVPRSLNAAELSRKEAQELQARLAQRLAEQKILREADLRRLLRLPSPERANRLPIVVAIPYMMFLDVARMFGVARLRRHALHGVAYLTTLGGFLSTGHFELEGTIDFAREEAALSKRILFLSSTHKVFHLWHVVHRPFSYTFAVLAAIHIAVVFLLGYR